MRTAKREPSGRARQLARSRAQPSPASALRNAQLRTPRSPVCAAPVRRPSLPPSARSSVATEWVKGRSLEECLAIKNVDIASHLKLPPVKLHCSMLAEDAIKAAVKDYATKNGIKVAAAEGKAAEGTKQTA